MTHILPAIQVHFLFKKIIYLLIFFCFILDVCVNVDLLCHILSEFKQILQSPEAHIENVNFICDILGNIWCTINVENKVCLRTCMI